MTNSEPARYRLSKPRIHFTDPRPASPAQLAVIGLGIWMAGVVIHSLAILVPIGICVLLVAGVAQLLRPRTHTMYWRGRQIDLDDEPTATGRLYRAIFKH